MKFICNSSVLIFLAKLDALYLLKRDFFVIPARVKESAEKDRLALFLKSKNVTITKPKKNRKISNALGKGEMEVITLALLIDDRRACSLAKSLGLMPKGTLWIILNSIKTKRLKKIRAKQYLYDLPGLGFRIDEMLLMEILKKL